ncbi:MAG TPA: sigma-70 family RNA polymerase sigma factor [Thermomicrobiales bacterium]|jgi:RNA polymerase sigma-70 factor (ECF subfamily)|nr:sigma-70 family RNA polymerase sigma factor [Thermomicrobiales bacterium]
MVPEATRDDAGNRAEFSDADLIGLASQGDPQALEVLYDRYSRVVFSFALRIVNDQLIAEEVLQEVFFRAWQQGGSFRASKGTFLTWLLSITHNMAIDEVRKRKRRPQRSDSDDPDVVLAAVADGGPSVEDEVWLRSLRDRIARALDTLPAAQREAIELAYFRGMTHREIAEALGEPLGTIKTRMRLGMLKLRDQLDGSEVGLA